MDEIHTPPSIAHAQGGMPPSVIASPAPDASSLKTAITALLLTCALLFLFQFLSLRGAFREAINVQAAIVGENSIAALLFKDTDAADETLALLSKSKSIDAAIIYTPDLNVLASYQRPGKAAMDIQPDDLRRPGYRFTLMHLEIVRRIDIGGESLGYIAVQASLMPLYRHMVGAAIVIVIVSVFALTTSDMLVSGMRRKVIAAEENVDYLQHIDPLTSLPNRQSFSDRLAGAILKANQFGDKVTLLLLDLDNFKVINDTLGHYEGDLLLGNVAKRLRASLRTSDQLYRIGGDEFAIIIENFDINTESHERSVVEKVLTLFELPFVINTHELYITTSVGSSVFPDDAGDIETLIRAADAAMYHAKGKGKNTHERFMPELEKVAQKRLTIESALRKALDRGELEVYFQPQVSIRDGTVLGLEALLRWNRPGIGVVSPADFIPIAEETGLIVPIGRWVLHEACKHVASWHKRGIGTPYVAVNLSARQMFDKELMTHVLSALYESGLPAHCLELEITETILMENGKASLALIDRIHAEGIHLSIDDFGTGYSSMAYLKRLPFDTLKIDKAFVDGIPGDRENEAIVLAIIAMAHSLQLSVVAEGVETEAQMAYLRHVGCDIAQGFVHARPLPAAEAEDFLRTGMLRISRETDSSESTVATSSAASAVSADPRSPAARADFDAASI